MGQFYNLTNSQDSKIEKLCTFDAHKQQIVIEESSTYMGVLRVLREAFSVIDFDQIIRNRLNQN